MEIISTIHFHIPHVISLWTFIYGKHGNIGKKNSCNKEASDNSHTYFSHIQREMAPGRTAKPLGG